MNPAAAAQKVKATIRMGRIFSDMVSRKASMAAPSCSRVADRGERAVSGMLGVVSVVGAPLLSFARLLEPS